MPIPKLNSVIDIDSNGDWNMGMFKIYNFKIYIMYNFFDFFFNFLDEENLWKFEKKLLSILCIINNSPIKH